MKVNVEIEFKDLSVEKIQQTLLNIISALKSIDMIENASFQIHTPDGVITEKCIVEKNRLLG